MRYTITLILFLAPFSCSSATGQASDEPPGLGANAALKYWTAFALLPTADELQEMPLNDWNTVPLDQTVLGLIDRSRNSRESLHQGAKLDGCDWGLDYSQGIRLLMPHLIKSRSLAALTALDARKEFEQGHWNSGAEDVTALLKLARHLEMEPMMIQQLVAYGIERTAIEAAAPFLLDMTSALPELELAVFESPRAATLEQMVRQEKQMGPIWLIRELKAAQRRKPDSWRDVWTGLFGESEGAEQDFLEPPATLDETILLLEGLLPLYDELATMTALSWKEFDVLYPPFVEKGKAANRLFGLLVPAVGKFVASERRHPTQLALFKAALVVVRNGPDELKEIKDPFDGAPFDYRPRDKGFELRSNLRYQEKPVTLTVGPVK